MKLLEHIHNIIFNLEPDSEIFLFGSRARKDFIEDSDWDILILINEPISQNRKDNLIDSLYELELQYSIVFNIIIHSKDYWLNNKVFRQTPFYKNVEKDKIPI